MTELLVGTKKGLFRLEGDPTDGFEITARAFPGQSVEYAMRDPRTGRYLASVTSWFYGPRIWVTDDPTGEWEQAKGTVLPGDDEVDPAAEFSGDPDDMYKGALNRLWVIVPGEEDGVLYAGGDPGPLFESSDGGLTWSLNRGLWDHPTRPEWNPGGGGLCLHTIVTWPGDPSKLLVAISANEIRRLFALLTRPPIDEGLILHWSHWRRRHQARSRQSHYRRRSLRNR